MPVLFGVDITSATYSSGTLTVNGAGFGDIEYPVSLVEVSTNGVAWTSGTNTSWSDTQVVATFSPALTAGTYRVRVTSSNNEQDTLLAAFSIASGLTSRASLPIAIWIGV